jgi:hypothetical protein
MQNDLHFKAFGFELRAIGPLAIGGAILLVGLILLVGRVF